MTTCGGVQVASPAARASCASEISRRRGAGIKRPPRGDFVGFWGDLPQSTLRGS